MKTLTAEEISARHNAKLAEAPKPGHNSNAQLKDYVARFLAIAEQQESLREDLKELSAEAKDHDLNPAAIKKIVKTKMETAEKREKREAVESTVDTYKMALGMLN